MNQKKNDSGQPMEVDRRKIRFGKGIKISYYGLMALKKDLPILKMPAQISSGEAYFLGEGYGKQYGKNKKEKGFENIIGHRKNF